jgi:hypothetical protein
MSLSLSPQSHSSEIANSADFFDYMNAEPDEPKSSYFNFKSVWE